jgi:prepilin-type N-terminal cleavage/methylation domain-containing protein
VTDAGYTLTETLAAMVVIGLAVGGYSVGMQVLAAQQGAVAAAVLKVQAPRAAQAWLERRLEEHGAYRTQETAAFSGSADGFRFACAAAAPCTLDLVDGPAGQRLRVFRGEGPPVLYRLPGAEAARFVYRGAGEDLPSWPPGDGTRQSLRAVALLQGEGTAERTVFQARLRTEQPLDCAFDPVIQDCR